MNNSPIEGPQINSLENRHGFEVPKKKHPLLRALLIVIGVAILALGIFIIARANNLTGKIFVGQRAGLLGQFGSLLGGTKLKGEDNGQINVLLLGIGGEGHDGPYLTDSIIVAEIRPGDKKATMISIPRDYFVQIGNGYSWAKINSAFADGYADGKNYDTAGRYARETVEKVTGLDIPYFAVVDFQGFQKGIDLVGGVDIHVDRTFTDYAYPDSGTGYLPAQTFTEGDQHMNGSRALIYARSRHAAGPEGTDFARGVRQQKMLQAFKTKVVQLNLITDSNKVNQLLDVLGDHFHTNLSLAEMFHLYDIGHDWSKDQVTSLSLDPSTGLVCDGKDEASGAYILTPCDGKTSSDIQNFFKNSFSTSKLAAEKSVVWLADSTKGGKQYNTVAKQLTAQGATVIPLTYSGTTLTQNVVYEINDKPGTLKFIKDTFNASEVTLPPPGVKINKDKADLIMIIGSGSN